VIDLVRGWKAPHSPESVVAEMAIVLRSYGVRRVIGDRYGGEWPKEVFLRNGIAYDVAPRSKSEAFVAMLAHVNGGRVWLPDHPTLRRELNMLERRKSRAGRDLVDHPPGQHDDLANAAALVADALLSVPVQAVCGIRF
jgi:hypothetical protein